MNEVQSLEEFFEESANLWIFISDVYSQQYEVNVDEFRMKWINSLAKKMLENKQAPISQ